MGTGGADGGDWDGSRSAVGEQINPSSDLERLPRHQIRSLSSCSRLSCSVDQHPHQSLHYTHLHHYNNTPHLPHTSSQPRPPPRNLHRMLHLPSSALPHHDKTKTHEYSIHKIVQQDDITRLFERPAREPGVGHSVHPRLHVRQQRGRVGEPVPTSVAPSEGGWDGREGGEEVVSEVRGWGRLKLVDTTSCWNSWDRRRGDGGFGVSARERSEDCGGVVGVVRGVICRDESRSGERRRDGL